jgi:hypothetical protein
VYAEDMLPVVYKLATCLPPDSEADARRLQRMPRVGAAAGSGAAALEWPPAACGAPKPSSSLWSHTGHGSRTPPPAARPQVKAMLSELVAQMAAQHHLCDMASAAVSPAEAALHLLCRFYGASMTLADMRSVHLPGLACLPFVGAGGGPARKLPLVHCSIMEALAGRVTGWVDAGTLPAMGLLHTFERALVMQIRVSWLGWAGPGQAGGPGGQGGGGGGLSTLHIMQLWADGWRLPAASSAPSALERTHFAAESCCIDAGTSAGQG